MTKTSIVPGWGLSQGHDAFAGLAGHVILAMSYVLSGKQWGYNQR